MRTCGHVEIGHLAEEVGERKEAKARHRTSRRQGAGEQPFDQHYGRHGRDIGAMSAPGDQSPVDTHGRAVLARLPASQPCRPRPSPGIAARASPSAAARPNARAGAAAPRAPAKTAPTVPDGRRRLRARQTPARCAGPDIGAAANRGQACRPHRASARRDPEWYGGASSANRGPSFRSRQPTPRSAARACPGSIASWRGRGRSCCQAR